MVSVAHDLTNGILNAHEIHMKEIRINLVSLNGLIDRRHFVDDWRVGKTGSLSRESTGANGLEDQKVNRFISHRCDAGFN